MAKQHTFTQPQVLAITGLDAPTLQTWVNRGHVQLPKINPGKGRSRTYTEIDCVRLTIMRHAHELGLPLSLGKDIAESVVADFGLAQVPRLLCLYLDAASIRMAPHLVSAPRLYKYRTTADGYEQYTLKQVLVGFTNADLRRGVPRPVIVFPVGEIVHATLAVIRSMKADI